MRNGVRTDSTGDYNPHVCSDRKLTKAELVLAMRRDDGSLASLLGLPSPVVSSMDEHREFNRVFEALDCQRGSRSMITFDEFHEYADSQYSQRTAEGQARLAMAAGALLALLLLAYGWRRAAKQQRVHDKST